MLKCETNTPAMETEIRAAASTSSDIGNQHKNLSTAYEHGQWWVSCLDCSAQWSVCDCQKDGENYFGFESLSDGDDSCFHEDSEQNTNCLAGMQCPECKSLGPYRMNLMHNVIVSDEGTEATGDTEWDNNTFCMCEECNFEGTIYDFLIKKPVHGRTKSVQSPSMDVDNRPNHVDLSDRELNQVLAALRHWQYSLPRVASRERYSEYLEDGLTFMNEIEIDELCERFNLGPVPEEDKYSHIKQVSDGYFCERHQKLSPGRYCPDC